MKRFKRAVGVILFLCGASACGMSEPVPRDASGKAMCRAPGAQCRWDDQCCSTRCYVDTGCAG